MFLWGALVVAPSAFAWDCVIAIVDETGNPAPKVQAATIGRPDRAVFIPSDAQGKVRLSLPSAERDWPVFIRQGDGRMQGFARIPANARETPNAERKVVLKPAHGIVGRVEDANGSPVADAWVDAGPASLYWGYVKTDAEGRFSIAVPADAPLPAVVALKSGVGFDYVEMGQTPEGDAPSAKTWNQPVVLKLKAPTTLTVKVANRANQPAPGLLCVPVSIDLTGRSAPVSLTSSAIAFAAANAEGIATFAWIPEDSLNPIVFRAASVTWSASESSPWEPGSTSRQLEMTVRRKTQIVGRVFLPDGRPAAGMEVFASGQGWEISSEESTVTAANGAYSLNLAPEQSYLVNVISEKYGAQSLSGVFMREGDPKAGQDIYLIEGTLVTGTVRDEATMQPVPERTVRLFEAGGEFALQRGTERRTFRESLERFTTTNAEGKYAFRVGPGRYELQLGAGSVTELTVDRQKEQVEDFSIRSIARHELKGRVVDGDGKPLANVRVRGQGLDPADGVQFDLLAGSDGRFSTSTPVAPGVILATSDDDRLGGLATTESAARKEGVAVKLSPTASLTARLVDSSGMPVIGAKISWNLVYVAAENVPPVQLGSLGGQVTTGPDGEFEATGLLVGRTYSVLASVDGDGPSIGLTTVSPDKAEAKQGGSMTLPAAAGAVTMADRVKQTFARVIPVKDRLRQTLLDCQRDGKRMLIVVGSPETPHIEGLFSLLFESDIVDRLLWDYELTPVLLTEASELPATYRVPPDARAPKDLATLAVVDGGRALEAIRVSSLKDGDDVAEAKLAAFLAKHAVADPDARDVMQAALKKAAKESKRILLHETGPRNGPCRRFGRWIDAQRRLLDSRFVYVQIDSARMSNSEPVLEALRPEYRGLPWIAVLDASGKLLGSTDGDEGNYGFANTPELADRFAKLLTSHGSWSAEDSAALRASLPQAPAGAKPPK